MDREEGNIKKQKLWGGKNIGRHYDVGISGELKPRDTASVVWERDQAKIEPCSSGQFSLLSQMLLAPTPARLSYIDN